MRLEICDLAKAYAEPVLRGVNLAIEPGEIRGLVGENGAGKSTLINIIGGLVRADAGSIKLDGEVFRPRRPRDALDAGISVASQELSLCEGLSVEQNLLLPFLPARAGVIDGKALRTKAGDLIGRVGLDGVRPEQPLSDLSLSQRQLLEFAKAISRPCRLLILDEPTAALTSHQAEGVHDVLLAMARQGVAVLYVSHRLEDVRTVCDRISVLRDGQMITTQESSNVSVAELIAAMSGDRIAATPSTPRERRSSPGATLLQARDVTTRRLPHPIDLELRSGEILCVAGLAGAGRTELLEAVYGLAPLRSGSISSRRRPSDAPSGPAKTAEPARIGFLTEDRKRSGIFAGHSIEFNMGVAALASFSPRGVVDTSRERSLVNGFIEKLSIRCTSANQDIARLSGGNQQKVLLARWLLQDVDILLLDEPTRGMDAASKADLHEEVRRLAQSGCAVLLVSSELEEFMDLAHRIIVLSGKKIVAEFTEPPWDSRLILESAFDGFVGRRSSEENPAREIS